MLDTQDVQTDQNRFNRFLDVCEVFADYGEEVLRDCGMNDLAHNGPGMIKFYVERWREAGKPSDSMLGTAGLYRGLDSTLMALDMVGALSPDEKQDMENLMALARGFNDDRI